MRNATTTAFATGLLALATTLSAFPVQLSYYPATNSIYHIQTGALEFDNPGGQVFRDAATPNATLSTLVNFYFQEQSAGKTCVFNFELDSPGFDISVGAGMGAGAQFDVFRSSKPVLESSNSSANHRDRYLGRMQAVPYGQATLVQGSVTFACPEPDPQTPVAFEVVPVGDAVSVAWSKQDGPWIRYY